MLKKCFYLLIFILTNMILGCLFLHRVIKDIFGVVTLDQIIFNINGGEGVIDSSAYGSIIFWSVVYIIVFIVHLIIFINFAWKRRPVDEMLIYRAVRAFEVKLVEIIKHSPRYTYAAVCVLACAFVTNYLDTQYGIVGYLNKPSSTFIEENYTVPTIEFKEKRNLVLIFLESMEHGYSSSQVFEENLIQHLQWIARKNITFFGHKETFGSEWTQAAHVNMLMGIPLLFWGKVGISQERFLPGAVSITDILSQNGYKIYSLFGATGRFANMGTLFSSHGVHHVWERDHFDSLGYNKPKNRGIWGYKDSFIYDKMLALYEELKASDEPFCLIMRTVDTHFPHGFAEERYRKFGDIRDSFTEADRMCASFVKKIRSIGKDDTTIVLVGDHLWMDTPGIEFTDSMIPNLKYRQIYNAFINSCVKPARKNKARSFAAFDMAPTILESIGAKLEGGRFGLGVSLFANKKTLVERYGVDRINEEFDKFSEFYGTFVNGPAE